MPSIKHPLTLFATALVFSASSSFASAKTFSGDETITVPPAVEHQSAPEQYAAHTAEHRKEQREARERRRAERERLRRERAQRRSERRRLGGGSF